MRWDLIHHFEVLKKGIYSRAVKSYDGTEPFFREHYPAKPLVPEPFFIEMIAQAGGVLFGLSVDFKKEIILVKIDEAVFLKAVAPPCEFVIEARIEEEREEGVWISGVVSMGKEKVAEARIFLATVDSLVEGKQQIVFSDTFMKQYNILEIARKSEGMTVS